MLLCRLNLRLFDLKRLREIRYHIFCFVLIGWLFNGLLRVYLLSGFILSAISLHIFLIFLVDQIVAIGFALQDTGNKENYIENDSKNNEADYDNIKISVEIRAACAYHQRNDGQYDIH